MKRLRIDSEWAGEVRTTEPELNLDLPYSRRGAALDKELEEIIDHNVSILLKVFRKLGVLGAIMLNQAAQQIREEEKGKQA